ncbi:MAG: hypothetical protein COB54_00045 [Alphaproteobacteria bacterium]|nr:MAG: hypothetical protein COB54_00045 [Alphaproteobacteria bacterium]
MFTFFPDNYAWSMITNVEMEMVGTVSEITDAIEPLKAVSGLEPTVSGRAWYETWTALGKHLEKLGTEDNNSSRRRSAARKFFRSGHYFLIAIRFLAHTDSRYLPSYQHAVKTIRLALQLRGDPVEWVEIPFGDKTLKAMYVKAKTTGPAPCMIVYNGFDVTKEYIHPVVAEPFTSRGISLLITDQPGSGAALIEDNIPAVPETEHSAAACIDYLETRSDVDPSRIGIIGASLGGYYAPRAAAFEKRLAACIAWGGVWDAGEIHDAIHNDPSRAKSINDWDEHAMWISGTSNSEDCREVFHRMTLKHVADKITCPLLIMHGENDRQVTERVAERTLEAAINSSRAELKIFTREHGGSEHCHADNIFLGTDYMADWTADVLGGDLNGGAK